VRLYLHDGSALTGFAATYTSNGVTLPAGGSIVHNHAGQFLDESAQPAGNVVRSGVGGLHPECWCVVNQLQTGAAGDASLSYNAFTVTP